MIFELFRNDADIRKATDFLTENEHLLPDPLSFHVNLTDYVLKLLTFGRIFTYETDLVCGICMGYINDFTCRTAHLQVLIIRKEAQGLGFGKELVSRFLSEAKKAGMNDVVLTCDKVNTSAQMFYRMLGFVESSQIHPNPLKIIFSHML